ncbi:MAG: ABC transporter permease [Thermoguttaceae bacterium]|nr:ABC transporter permease [Thermoguttaceae bacterium]
MAHEWTAEKSTLLDWLIALAGKIGKSLNDRIIFAGQLAAFSFSTIYWLFARPAKKETMVAACYRIGVQSLPVIMLTGTFIGMVLAVQTHPQFKAVGLESRLGAAINLSLVKELGPVLAATMLAGRVGSAIAAELGTMRVTEQIDALASMGPNPIHYLVVPRFIACLIMIPGLTIMADAMGVLGGAFFSIKLLGVDWGYYWEYSRNAVALYDVFAGMFKSIFFGGAIALISCYQGFNCDAGAEGVGKASTKSFVVSFVMILILDLILGIFLDKIHVVWFGGGPKAVV